VVSLKNPKEWKLVGFEKHPGKKKFNALLEHKTTGDVRRIPFGQKGYQQYKDKALGLYSHLDHGDKARRDRYRLRHDGEQYNNFSSGYFAYRYLW
jgi:hypothetical protein